MKKLALLASICLPLILNGRNGVAAQGQGIIEGQVVNGTAEASPQSVAGLEVVLYTLNAEGQEFKANTTTDEEGRFHFEGLDTNAEHSYRFQLDYQDITYSGESAFPRGETVLPIMATVYETTRSDEAMVVNRHHVITDFAADALIIQEVYVFDNTADRIYVGEEQSTLVFSLPADATDPTLDDPRLESNTIETDEGFASRLPVAPGESQVLFSYTLPYDGRDRTLVRKILYPTSNFDLMIADVGVQGESPQLAYRGLKGGEETSYLHFGGQDLLPNSEIQIRLSGTPQLMRRALSLEPSLGLRLQGISAWIALSLALLGAVTPFTEVYLRARSQKAKNAGLSRVQTIAHAGSKSQVQRQELLQLIADLDDAFADGRITEEAYQELRKSMKGRVIDMRPD
jgi:5-hydroxyisourate hydrolase-like protein (transthyretin family)